MPDGADMTPQGESMYTENFMICTEPEACEICGRQMPEASPCVMCQVWVQNYSEALMVHSRQS
jgi:hypothetical protein